MSLQRPTIVLFDMDGTTVRHLDPRLLHMLEVLDDAAHKSAAFFSKLFKRNIKSPPLVEFHKGKRKKRLVHRAIHKIRRKPVDQIVEPCPGIFDFLDLLKANNIRMGIISNGLGKGYGHDILETFDLAPYFDVTIFREDIRRAKPHPDPILQALEAMDTPPTADDVIWYIGDRNKDILAAIAAREHLPCVIEPLGYNLNTVAALIEKQLLGPDHLFIAWIDLEAKLRRLLKAK